MDVNRGSSLATLRRRLIRKAEAGDVDAMMEYCSTYPDVELAKADNDARKRVLRYLRSAAKKGCAEAWCNLGASYYGGGFLVKCDYKKAVACYEKSAALGCAQAMVNLGYCHYYGREISVDYAQAFQWFLKAYIETRGWHSEACYKLGDCFRYGRGTAMDLRLAFALYKQAYSASWSPKTKDFVKATHGWDDRLKGADSALRLADSHRFGLGTEIDQKSAKHYYLIALAGFKRKMKLLDPFAESLYYSALCRLAELRTEIADVGPKRRRGKFALACDVVGLRFVEDLARKLRGLKVGDELGLLRDPGNAHDANAIAVVSPAGSRIGWIPRACNTAPAALMDRGVALAARITNLNAAAGEEAISLSLTAR